MDLDNHSRDFCPMAMILVKFHAAPTRLCLIASFSRRRRSCAFSVSTLSELVALSTSSWNTSRVRSCIQGRSDGLLFRFSMATFSMSADKNMSSKRGIHLGCSQQENVQTVSSLHLLWFIGVPPHCCQFRLQCDDGISWYVCVGNGEIAIQSVPLVPLQPSSWLYDV